MLIQLAVQPSGVDVLRRVVSNQRPSPLLLEHEREFDVPPHHQALDVTER